MTIQQITSVLESWAPLSYQENYDNSGLIVGDPQLEVTKALITLDCIEEVIDEAIREKCNFIIAHHPIVFSGLKKLNGKNYVERTIMKAIKNDIAIYAIHTNLDNISIGVNAIISEKLGLQNTKILSPKNQILKKLVTYIPIENFEKVSQAIFEAGAGNIGNYSQCGFSTEGEGTFLGNQDSNPQLGNPGKIEKVKEKRFETIFPAFLEGKIIKALIESHQYEEVAYDIYTLDNYNQNVGSGMIGELENDMRLMDFLKQVKDKFRLESIKYTNLDRSVKKIAFCGGSGSFLRGDALRAGADVYLTSDMKYHEWFDAEGQIAYVDIGHYEIEQYTKELISKYLEKNILSLQTQISRVNTNPVKYYL